MSLLINPFGAVVDFAPGDVLNFKFLSTDASGVPTAVGGGPTVAVYQDDNTTESTTGVTLTTGFDGRTGLNNVKINTAADSTFYAVGHAYDVVLTAGTIGAVSVVGTPVGHFQLSRLLADAWEGIRRILEVAAEIKFQTRGIGLGGMSPTDFFTPAIPLRTRAP